MRTLKLIMRDKAPRMNEAGEASEFAKKKHGTFENVTIFGDLGSFNSIHQAIKNLPALIWAFGGKFTIHTGRRQASLTMT